MKTWLTSEPDLSHGFAEVLIMILSFAAGNIDSLTISVLHVFIANMTGNVVLLGLAAAGLRSDYPDLIRPVRDALAVVFFLVGCFLVGRVTAFTGRRRQRGLLLFFSCLETTIFFACTAVIYSVRMDLDDDTDPATIAVVCLLSFAMGSQQIWGRDLGIPEVTITVLTNASASILADPKLFAPITANRSRNVRLVFVTVFFVGCIIGGVMLNFVNLATALLLNAILKLAGPITFLITRNKVITGSDISKSEELTIDQIQHGNP